MENEWEESKWEKYLKIGVILLALIAIIMGVVHSLRNLRHGPTKPATLTMKKTENLTRPEDKTLREEVKALKELQEKLNSLREKIEERVTRIQQDIAKRERMREQIMKEIKQTPPSE